MKIMIFDIDGTICDSFFPNLGETADIKQLKKNILNTPLNPDFIQYFKRISKSSEIKTYFLTGRRKKDFWSETLYQLKELNIDPEYVLFFPDDYSHSRIRYECFKIYNILKMARENKDSELIMYDDLDGYLPKLLSMGLELGIQKLSFQLVKDLDKYWKIKAKDGMKK